MNKKQKIGLVWNAYLSQSNGFTYFVHRRAVLRRKQRAIRILNSQKKILLTIKANRISRTIWELVRYAIYLLK